MFLPAEIILVLAHFAPAFTPTDVSQSGGANSGHAADQGAAHGDGGVADGWVSGGARVDQVSSGTQSCTVVGVRSESSAAAVARDDLCGCG